MDRYDNQVIKIKFSMKDCKRCLMKAHCTTAQRRTISVRVKEHHEALQQARARQKNAAFGRNIELANAGTRFILY